MMNIERHRIAHKSETEQESLTCEAIDDDAIEFEEATDAEA
jgi:hypothetical protein